MAMCRFVSSPNNRRWHRRELKTEPNALKMCVIVNQSTFTKGPGLIIVSPFGHWRIREPATVFIRTILHHLAHKITAHLPGFWSRSGESAGSAAPGTGSRIDAIDASVWPKGKGMTPVSLQLPVFEVFQESQRGCRTWKMGVSLKALTWGLKSTPL